MYPLDDDETSQLSPSGGGVLVELPLCHSVLPSLSAFGILPCSSFDEKLRSVTLAFAVDESSPFGIIPCSSTLRSSNDMHPLGDDEISQLSPSDRGVRVGNAPCPSALPSLSAFGMLPCSVVLFSSSADGMHPHGR